MLAAILTLAGASSLLMTARDVAYADIEQAMVPERGTLSSAARLRTALDGVDPDTVWIGHIYDPTYTAGGTMTPGGYGPYRVGRGPYLSTFSNRGQSMRRDSPQRSASH